jgi:thiamine-phosphate pyrophosphorylase
MVKNRKFQYHLITDHNCCRETLHEVAQKANRAGVDFFHLREKSLPAGELLLIARHLRPFLNRTRLIINGRLDVALAAEADGVHLQEENIPVAAVRQKYPRLLVGYSAHSREELLKAQQEGAAYLFISPVFAPISKETALQPIGPHTVRKWIRGMKVPVIGLGGITAENVGEVRAAGCAGAAGISLFIEQCRFTAKGMVV